MGKVHPMSHHVVALTPFFSFAFLYTVVPVIGQSCLTALIALNTSQTSSRVIPLSFLFKSLLIALLAAKLTLLALAVPGSGRSALVGISDSESEEVTPPAAPPVFPGTSTFLAFFFFFFSPAALACSWSTGWMGVKSFPGGFWHHSGLGPLLI